MRKMIKTFMAVWMLLLSSYPTSFIYAHTNKPDIKFQSIKSGLVNLQVSSIIQDRFGFLWIGTVGGLHRYDGLKFTLYQFSEIEHSINSNHITSLYEDLSGNIWVGTTQGLCVFDRDKNTFHRYKTVNPDNQSNLSFLNRIRSILEDNDGQLWVSSEGEGLFYLNKKTNQFDAFPVGSADHMLSSHRTTDLELDNKGNLWIGTIDKGINVIIRSSRKVLKDESFENQRKRDQLSVVWTLRKGMSNKIWIGTKGDGIFVADLKNDNRIEYKHYLHNESDPNSIGNNDIYDIFLDSKNRIWIGNENGGLHIYNQQEDNFYKYESNPSDPFSISHNSIWSIYEDKEERIWIGTALQGINYYDKYYTKFSHYYNRPGDNTSLNNNVVRSFWEEENGNIWIATDGGGLNYFDRKNQIFRGYKHRVNDPSSPSSDAMLNICQNRDGELMIGTWGGGICVLKDKQKMIFEQLVLNSYPDSLTSNHFYLLRDENDNIWSADYGVGLGMFDWKTKEFKTYLKKPNTKGELTGDLIISLCLDSENNIWLGSDSFGINKLIRNKGKEYFIQYFADSNNPSSLPSNMVHQIFEDKQKNIWIATDRGFCQFDKEKDNFKIFTTKDGLPTDYVLSITEDDNANLWLGTTNGLVRFNPQTLTFTSFGVNDGVQGKEFSRYSAKKLSTGELIFGGMNGFNIFHPDSVISNPHIPKVYITDFKIYNNPVEIDAKDSPLNKHISVTEHITLNYKQNVFSFEFTALNYTRSDQNMFAFILEGLEDNWNYVGSQRNAAYSNLSPGEYTFRVKASNNDGVWNEKGRSLGITVLPPWWNTWWAYALWFLILLSIIYGIVRFRTAYLQGQRSRLKDLVTLRTHELELRNERISMQAEELNAFNDALKDLNENLEKTVQDRTNELILKNKKLAEYAFINAHNLRVPVANIKGVIQLFEVDRTKQEILELLEILKGQSNNLDAVLFDIKHMLEKDELLFDEHSQSN